METDLRHIIPLFIPIVAIVMGIGIAMLAIFLDYRKRSEMFALHHQERMAAIEKGLELPPLPEAFFSASGKVCSPHRRLRSGLVLLMVGLTVMIAMFFNGKVTQSLYALIPMGIGLANIIYYFMVDKRRAEIMEAEQAAQALEKRARQAQG